MANIMTICNIHTKLLLCYILKTQIKSKYLASRPDEHVWRHCLPVLSKLHYAKVPHNQAYHLAYYRSLKVLCSNMCFKQQIIDLTMSHS